MPATLTFPTSDGSYLAQRPKPVRVRSADELRRALREARERPLLLDATALDCVLRLDGERGILEAQAAATWQALARYLGPRGAALAAVAQTPGMPRSVGDALSTNAAGPDGVALGAHVEAITLVTPDGELKRADRNCNPDLFRLVIGGHGVFGVLYSVTLRLDSLRRAAQQAEAPVELDLASAGSALPIAHQTEVLVPPGELDALISEVRALAEERRIALHRISVRKLRPEAETFLCWASRDWAGVRLGLGIRPTLGACVHATEIRRLILGAALARGGSFPVVAACDASRAQLEACYPRLAAFLAEKRRYDPCERLQNEWYRRVTAILRREPCESRWDN